ncbi:uncharacterized protein LACBIDRAFT_331341 [Laccaria bicolor S238N-H82]|uniref:Predicted protein n=1 Tax=Laccaria bicolor (strain S238N-H82 / ATCC MYA-4686) TaxID=486041 RepID=B0DP71_LACBS|nr:uncharacterized protein LACBIDRAFT_331341 [Laccaria bicolor S238N-H82]EDR03634.1 predicted protein [Laccaria bicolor S238N-H82]|eukprot:XP_001885782.1 predicted protein [Laccaria bicolor S238N-H82]
MGQWQPSRYYCAVLSDPAHPLKAWFSHPPTQPAVGLFARISWHFLSALYVPRTVFACTSPLEEPYRTNLRGVWCSDMDKWLNLVLRELWSLSRDERRALPMPTCGFTALPQRLDEALLLSSAARFTSVRAKVVPLQCGARTTFLLAY